MKQEIDVMTQLELEEFGQRLGATLNGGEVIELIGDVGAGKTTFTKALARGLGINEPMQSPTFTISNRYEARDNLALVHYDFYRLGDAGIMQDELIDTFSDHRNITVIEWADTIRDVLPEDRVTISLIPSSETLRRVTVTGIL